MKSLVTKRDIFTGIVLRKMTNFVMTVARLWCDAHIFQQQYSGLYSVFLKSGNGTVFDCLLTIFSWSAQTKIRLKWSFFAHYVLVFVMLVKLLPDILDRLDIFVLEVEELMVPKPLFWEWLWLLSVPFSFLGLMGCKKSNVGATSKFLYGTTAFGLLPVFIGMVVHFSELYIYSSTKKIQGVQVWNGYPVAVLWYLFLFLALQVHCFEIFFAKTLINAIQFNDLILS